VGRGAWIVGRGAWSVGRGNAENDINLPAACRTTWAGSGQWAVGGGQWAVGGGQWAVGGGQ